MKKVYASISSFLFDSMREDWQNNSPQTRQAYGGMGVLCAIAAVAGVLVPWWHSPFAFIVLSVAGMGAMVFVMWRFREK